MPRQIQIYLPGLPEFDQKRKEVQAFLESKPEILSFSSFSSSDSYLYLFRVDDKRAARIIEELGALGVGVDFGTIDIIQLQGTKPLLVSSHLPNRKKYRLNDRVAVEEIYENVDSKLHLTFDFILFTILASIISGVGLATGSAVTVVAAMLLDPFMSPILGTTLATVLKNKSMFLKSLRNEMIGVVLAFFIGFLMGIPLALIEVDSNSFVVWGTSRLRCASWAILTDFLSGNAEIMSRGTISSLWSGIAIAIPCGAAAALSVTSIQGGSIALVGVGISAALLPPVVNSGMNVSYGGMAILFADKNIPAKDGWKWLSVAMYSIILFAVNLCFIYLTGLLLFKVKKIGPLRDKSLAGVGADSSEYGSFPKESVPLLRASLPLGSRYVQPGDTSKSEAELSMAVDD